MVTLASTDPGDGDGGPAAAVLVVLRWGSITVTVQRYAGCSSHWTLLAVAIMKLTQNSNRRQHTGVRGFLH